MIDKLIALSLVGPRIFFGCLGVIEETMIETYEELTS